MHRKGIAPAAHQLTTAQYNQARYDNLGLVERLAPVDGAAETGPPSNGVLVGMDKTMGKAQAKNAKRAAAAAAKKVVVTAAVNGGPSDVAGVVAGGPGGGGRADEEWQSLADFHDSDNQGLEGYDYAQFEAAAAADFGEAQPYTEPTAAAVAVVPVGFAMNAERYAALFGTPSPAVAQASPRSPAGNTMSNTVPAVVSEARVARPLYYTPAEIELLKAGVPLSELAAAAAAQAAAAAVTTERELGDFPASPGSTGSDDAEPLPATAAVGVRPAACPAPVNVVAVEVSDDDSEEDVLSMEEMMALCTA
ncbi:MAG: hypothetical protein WDW38_011169 [Sanguina aurantia]